MKKLLITVFLLSQLFALNSYAGKDPIAWSISPSSGLPAQTTVGSSYSVTYTLTNNLPFSVPLTVSGAYTGGKFSMTNGCNTTLTNKGSCLVHLSFQPIKVGESTAVVTMAYHRNRVPLRLSSTAVSAETADRINGHVVTPLPAVTYTTASYPVKFTFVNNGDKAVTATAVNAVGFVPTSNGCLAALQPHSNCSVSGTYSPSSVGQASLNVTYVYSNGSVPLTTQTNVFNGGGGCHQISADVALPLPTSTNIYGNNVVKYVFTNNCSASVENIGAVTITSDQTASSVTTGEDTCSNTSLAPTSSCHVYASVIPSATAPASNDLSLTAALSYNNNAYTVDATTSEIVVALTNQSSLHTLTLVNQCTDKTVWEGFQPVSTPDPTPTATWQGHQLDQQITGAAPASMTMQFGSYFGGSIFGRTGCDTNPQSATYGVCTTANCTSLANSTGVCSSASNTPATIYEENMLATTASDGVYDISVINGFNLPGEFRSLAPTSFKADFSETCGQSAGAIIQPQGSTLGACAWTFTPPSTGTDCSAGTETDNPSNYYFVPAGADDGCTPGSCSAGQVCGMSWTAQPSSNPIYLGTPITRHCGTFQGYWTVADWIGYSNSQQWGASCNLYSHYAMTTTLDSIKPSTQATYGFSTFNPNLNPLIAATLVDMYGCQPTSSQTCYTNPGTPNACFNRPQNPYYALNSGYNAGITNACGCHDWNDTATTPASAQTAQASNCLSKNTLWDSKVYSRILWLKEACPTAYSYQFDDKSSSFTCNVTNQRTSYQITYCPGGKTGVPG